MATDDSLGVVLDRWRAGNQDAAADIYRRYEAQLVRDAGRKMSPKLHARFDPDDVMLSVMRTVMVRIRRGEYPSVSTSSQFGRLVNKILDNKVRKQAEFHRAKKRDVQAEMALELEWLPEQGTWTPEDMAILASELDRIRSRLKPSFVETLDLLLQGYSHPEIAEKLNLTRQAVRYRSERIGSVIALASQ
jgi:RNA polymerase sigma-70 factor (ECF subfamily)